MKETIFKTALTALYFVSFLLYSCSKEASQNLPGDAVPINLTSDQVLLIESQNSFAFDIFKEVEGNSSDAENLIISPLSLSCALSMTLNGANGATSDSILKTLRVSGITPEIINNSYKSLSESLLSVDKRVLISIANSVWVENDFVVKKPFTDILSEFYKAKSGSFDIKDPLAPTQINNWIESNTNGLIKNMIEKLNDNSVMLLINAIYFKGKWKSEFDKAKTVQLPFYKPDGSTAEVPMMKQTSDYKVYIGEGFVMAEFPYGQGNYVMDVIIPDDRNGLKDILPLLTDTNYKNWLNNMIEKNTNLIFPRFKYGYKKQLKDILSVMGMEMAFTNKADFSNISDLSLLINDVTHQAFIETNEEGTEAAAATVVDIGVTSIPVNPFVLNIDHSFLYLIRETTTNTIIFIGKVVDPLAG